MYLGILVSEKSADSSVWLHFWFKETLEPSEVVGGTYAKPVLF